SSTSNATRDTTPPISGRGTPGFLSRWKTATQLGNSGLFQTTAGNLGIATTTPTQKFEVDLGNALVRGSDNFTKGGDSAFLYIGDLNHPIAAIHSNAGTHSGGLTIGTFKAAQAIYLQDATGNVGIGIATAAPVARLDVASKSASAIHGQSASASQIGTL